MTQHTERLQAADLMTAIKSAGIRFNDLNTSQSSLQDIFVDLVKRTR